VGGLIEDDGLVIPEVGPWAKRKYHFLGRYLDIFSTGMKHKWPQRHYVDLFSGAGLAAIRGTGEIVEASPLIAASVKDPFTAIHLCELDNSKRVALEARLARRANCPYHVERGDANEAVQRVFERIPKKGSLIVSFVDPYGLHFDFSTVKVVASRQSDLIVLMADNMDALRSWALYADGRSKNLDRFMGGSAWKSLVDEGPSESLAQRLRLMYQEKLRTQCGYKHFATERVKNARHADIYTLLFASKHPKGLEFWDRARSVDEGGQRELFGS